MTRAQKKETILALRVSSTPGLASQRPPAIVTITHTHTLLERILLYPAYSQHKTGHQRSVCEREKRSYRAQMRVELLQRADDTCLLDEHDERSLFGKIVGRLGEGGVWFRQRWRFGSLAAATARRVRVRVSCAR